MDENIKKQTKVEKTPHIPLDKKVKFSRIKRNVFKHYKLLRVLLITIVVGVIALAFLGLRGTFVNSDLGNYMSYLGDFIFPDITGIKNDNGRINILVLGKGGLGHEAPDLTDTMIFVSLDTVSKKVTTISIPRDIWIPDLRAKINSAYYWGNQKNDSAGLVLAKETVSKILAKDVNYAVVIDFSAFKEVIDAIGGVDLYIENGFVDEKYPIAGKENDLCDGDPEYACRYETIVFESGVNHLNGENALKYVRSRNAKGDEGTDIARANRQEKVLKAIYEKVLSRSVILSPKKLAKLKNLMESNAQTDLSPNEIATLSRYIYESRSSVKGYVIPEDLLLNPPILPKYDNLYVFVPKAGTFKEIQIWVDEIY